jgi:hypothetical protein
MNASDIVKYLKANPGCIKALYDAEDRPIIDESELLDPNDWVDVTEEPDFVVWENENVSWGDGIRFCFEDGEVDFEGL